MLVVGRPAMSDSTSAPPLILICEPRRDCVDDNVNRWHCMRGHDGAAPDICPLEACERQGANRD